MDLEDLNYPSITDMSIDERIELLRQIRLSRRVPLKTKKRSNAIKKSRKKKAVPKVDASQANELLKILGGLN